MKPERLVMFDNTGLYIHIPFCVRKCNYCDFCSVGIGEGDETLTGRMVDALLQEMERVDLKDVATVFIGGGTPSVLPVGQMERLLESVRKKMNAAPEEFTVECNPGTVDEEKLRLFLEYGVDRLSFGCQSALDEELRALGRIHSWAEFLYGYEIARKIGFENINIDLMTAIPGQTVESLTGTLEKVIGLEPEHLSVYSLIIEEGTPFYERYRDEPPLDEETDRDLYELTCRMLGEAGYRHYEVSNYAKPDMECRHNRNYWQRGDYIGIGPAASSYSDGRRRTNVRDIGQYMNRVESGEDPTDEMEELTPEQKLLEAVYLGLRTSEGVRMSYLQDEFGVDLRTKWGRIAEELSEEGLLFLGEDTIRLTEKGFWLSDYILDKLM